MTPKTPNDSAYDSAYSARTLCGLAAAALTHVGRLPPHTVSAAVQDDPERAVELLLLCAAVAVAIPRHRWPALWSRPLQVPPFVGNCLLEVTRLDDVRDLRACVRRVVLVLADDIQSGEPFLT
jgi:hypothetical protein